MKKSLIIISVLQIFFFAKFVDASIIDVIRGFQKNTEEKNEIFGEEVRSFETNLDFNESEEKIYKNVEKIENRKEEIENINRKTREEKLKKLKEEKRKKIEKIEKIESFFSKYQKSVLEGLYKNIGTTKTELQNLKNTKNENYETVVFVRKKIEIEKNEIKKRSKRITTLAGQMKNLSESIEDVVNKQEEAKAKIRETETKIKDLKMSIVKKEKEIKTQKKLLEGYINKIYQEEKKIYNFNENEIKIISLIFGNTTVSQNLTEKKYAKEMQDFTKEIFRKLKIIKKSLTEKKMKLGREKTLLEKLKKDLTQQEKMQKMLSASKKSLLRKTVMEKDAYKKLLEKSKVEIINAEKKIQSVITEEEMIQEKLKLLNRKKWENENFLKTIELKAGEAVDFGIMDGYWDVNITWPVNPTSGITAYFRDSDYKKYFGVKHNAIDIKVRQGTNVYAPADSYVLKTYESGLKYSYIVLAHRNNFFTVYGHMSEIKVSEGDLVHLGEVIGLSGGIPGTKGAGWMTTGAHLHFEVYKDGKHIDPLSVLPLEYLPVSYIPQKWRFRLK